MGGIHWTSSHLVLGLGPGFAGYVAGLLGVVLLELFRGMGDAVRSGRP